jgi:Ser/Thr protein kinase RdoA (MazF antagonist)
MYQDVLQEYGLKEESIRAESFGNGLINNTWKITGRDQVYILQRVNEAVFKEPGAIANNIRLIADHLRKHYPGYLFAAPLTSIRGEEMVYKEGKGFFRLFPFITGSHSKDKVETPGQAYEAAAQFGRFTRLLSTMDLSRLKITIPSFHDLGLRYRQFQLALTNGNDKRIKASGSLIQLLEKHSGIFAEYGKIKTNPGFRLRVTHHDTKISNVLFNAEDKGLCVIDLDTVMPGYFISDVGDMMRTYLSPVSEEEKDVNKIEVRGDFYKAIVQGYLDEMKEELTKTEKNYFFYAGQFMIYMQALRFLTDYINYDVYYTTQYPEHNFVRAENQLTLLQRLSEKEAALSGII